MYGRRQVELKLWLARSGVRELWALGAVLIATSAAKAGSSQIPLRHV